jgi:hypothetical protein
LLNKKWRANNPEKSRAIYAKYRDTEKRRKIAREWARANREKGLKRFVERYASDAQFNLAIKFRRRIYMAIRKQFTIKAKKTIDLLGITYAEFKQYIEDRFTDGMTWEKILSGEIHLDHIKPVSLFDLTDIEEQKIAFNYTNIQPLWAKDNLRKHNNYNTPTDSDFKKCWALKNLQPLWKYDNLSKGNRLEKPFQPSLTI